ncbi:MAG: protein tyrosine phosphatase family protein [Pirellulaceae bacterium]|nr:protein tyrosine phosphatase family protein [Pirellulaceae bacterium]
MNRPIAVSVVCLTIAIGGQLLSAEAKQDAPELTSCSCFQANGIHEFGGVFLAGQPTPEGFAEAQKAGVRTVVNLRAANELNWDEKATVVELGMQYVHVPVASADALTDDVFQQMRQLLKDKAKRPMLVHCFSAGRVGATWLAHRVLDDGLTVEAAVAEAKTIGLKKEEYIAKATDYVRRMKEDQAALQTQNP